MTDLAAELAARVDAYRAAYAVPLLDHDDPGPALSDQALVDGDELWVFSQSVHDDGLVPGTVAQTLGLIRQIRSRHGPPERQLAESVAGLGLFSLAVYGVPKEDVAEDFRWLVDDVEAMALQAVHIGHQHAISGVPMLDRAIELFARVFATPGHTHPDRAVWLTDYSQVLQLRHGRGGDPALLDTAVRVAREAVATWPDEPVPALCHTNVEQSAWLRYDHAGAAADLDLAIDAARRSVDAGDEPDTRLIRMDHLVRHLTARAWATGSGPDLDDAIDTARAALALADAAGQDRPRRLAELAVRLHRRYLLGHDDVDLDTATRHARTAVAAADPGTPHLASVLGALARICVSRHARAWSMDDVEAAVRVGRAAVDAAPPGGSGRGVALTALAGALECRFRAVGDAAAVAEAVRTIRAATAIRIERGPDRADRAETLVRVLHAAGDVAEAAGLAREQAAALPVDHPRRPELLHVSATVLRDAGLPDEALAAERQALASCGPDDPLRGRCHALTAIVSLDQFRATGARRHLRAALAAARESVVDEEPAGPGRALLATVLAESRNRAQTDEAIRLWRAIAAEPGQPVAARMSAARGWADLAAARGDWAEALAGYESAVDLLPLLAWRGIDVAGRQRLLADWGGLAQDAAAAALSAGDPDRAVSLAEHGRAVLWSQVLAGRTDVGDLRSAAPALADRLADVRAELDRYAAPTDPATTDTSRYGNPGDRRLALARQFDALLAQARRVPGMASLLRAPDVRRLYPAVAGGAYVIVNVGRRRSDAIVVVESGPTVVPLPLVEHDDVARRVRRHLAAVRAPAVGSDVDRLDAVIAREQELAGTLAWLWRAVAHPVLRALGCDQPPPAGVRGPRIWWCPTGLLGMLPLHAAGDERRSVPDCVVPSYAPSLRTLAGARGTTTPRAGRMLLVAAPDVPGRPVLGHVADEVAMLRSLLPGGPHRLVADDAATRRMVLAELDSYPCVHFSCHGHQDLADPGTGGVALPDGTLTVTDLATSGAAGGEFAFLSACDTAVGGVDVPDESITLAAALHHVGYRQVIGTLWPVPDATAARLTGDVYRSLTRFGSFRPAGAAAALHDAVLALRAAAPRTPSVWASFVHVGA